MDLAPLELIEPATGETPVIVEVPHAGLWIDAQTLAWTMAPGRAIGRDADLYVDELAQETPANGATLLTCRASRYVVDLNRNAADYDGLAVVGGKGSGFPRGVVWRLTADDEPVIQDALPTAEFERRLDLVYRPYHSALDRLVQRKHVRFGGVVVISLHSMPSMGKSITTRQMTARADVVIGTRGRSTASAALISIVEEHTRSFGWSVAHDDPYRGGATTARLGQPHGGIHAVQVELARRLYMNEGNLSRKQDALGLVRSFCGGLVARIGAAALG
jgi:N-formylglutamate amidohydrolase